MKFNKAVKFQFNLNHSVETDCVLIRKPKPEVQIALKIPDYSRLHVS